MIREHLRAPALTALHRVLVSARSQAIEHPHAVARVLDAAELMPLLFLSQEDASESFRALLVVISCEPGGFAAILAEYDDSVATAPR
ncbi:MAG: hypothetical protein SFW67_31690 [Myxococcaceae bacterium]|nr:hypothetical protein [Myxococcaceae bacterium]